MPLIDRDDSVLIVVDTQPGFLASDDLEAEAAVQRAVWLAAIAQRLGIPAVLTEEAPEREGSTDPRLRAQLPGAPVFAKPSFGLAACPEIVAAIRDRARGTAVLTGFETDVCVLQSAIGLLELGFRVAAVSDASYTQNARQHAAGLRRMEQAGVEIVHAKGIAFEWLRTVELAIQTTRAVRELGIWPDAL